MLLLLLMLHDLLLGSARILLEDAQLELLWSLAPHWSVSIDAILEVVGLLLHVVRGHLACLAELVRAQAASKQFRLSGR